MAVEFFAGYVGGCAGVLIGHPFDTVKIRLQTQNMSSPLYRGTFDCFVSVVKRESVFGLYKGMSSPLYGVALINAVVFSVRSSVQPYMPNPNSLSAHFTAGSIAGVAQSVICSPIELAKTRMQVQGQGESRRHFAHSRHLYSDPLDCMRKMYRGDGLRGIFRGLLPTVCRDAPAFGVYFCAYESLCALLAGNGGDKDILSTPTLLFAGGMAGICAWLSTYPFDVVKSRYQADTANRYRSFSDCCRISYREMGGALFTKGLSSTLLRAFPTNAATLTTVTIILGNYSSGGTADDDNMIDLSIFAHQRYYHPHSIRHLTLLANFPSHP